MQKITVTILLALSRIKNPFILLSTLFLSTITSVAQENKNYNYLIKGGLVFDGSLNKPIKTDIGINGEKITYIEKAESDNIKADTIIDAEGLYVSPGFIDPHTHNGKWLNSSDKLQRRNLPALTQGVTTVFIGNDGFGSYSVAKKLNKYEKEGVGTNVAAFVGFSSVRKKILGSEDVTPKADELKEMRKLTAQGMKEGAFGLSTGLYYSPQSYAATDEVIAMAKEAKKYNGIYDTHMRSESNELIKAIEETISIGKATGIPLMISHIKALGPSAWGKSDEVIQLIEQAQKDEVAIFASQYPYIASHTSLKAMLIPSWAQSGGTKKMVKRLKSANNSLKNEISKNLAIRGGDSRITISKTKDTNLVGESLHSIAAKWDKSPEEAALKLLTKAPTTSAVSFSMDKEDINNFIRQPWVITGSDGGGRHPRTYGTFVRKIKKYSLDAEKITLTEAIHSSTGNSAELLGLKSRGFIKNNYYADIVIFDPDEIKDEATFQEPDLHASGINHVFVNGAHAIKDGKPTNKLSGKSLRHSPIKED